MSVETDCVVPNVSVVIVNYNAGKWLCESVSAALTQAQQIIVVDNASQDDSLTTLETQFLDDQRIQIIRSEYNQGFACACNRGARVATAPFILFLNPDCVLEPDCVLRLLKVIKQNPDIGMVGGLLVDVHGVEQRGCRRSIPTLRHSLTNLLGLSRFLGDFNLHKQPLPHEPIEIEATSGAMMLMRREALIDVKGWDEAYFLHCEDLDLCMQFSQKGWKIFFVPDAVAMHSQGVCSRSRPLFVSWHKHKGMLRFYRKFFRDRYPWLLMWVISFGIWVRFGVVVIRHIFLHKIHQFFREKHA